MTVTIGSRTLRAGHPACVIPDVGLNRNGEAEIAKLRRVPA